MFFLYEKKTVYVKWFVFLYGIDETKHQFYNKEYILNIYT